ncbi:hypothetical protein, conserved [Trypanosoma brucei brucei TREU927]|uniref:Rhodanese domain-containing protein n=1 Tax=Trypanosoma brucei brucei (strain 927/4 GUTat10.1) TaxID=185431 RepID=Q585K9_TRYB2|nr:hypothetical protein, conserved [Trypanosoma brucei brucei TREU927]AAX79197.1 hypothetical protein, conserved [Trypanosoma brucei]AAZ10932.1 hypothetical protein, conserved [Trypanosoma brucei brucei TREU927]
MVSEAGRANGSRFKPVLLEVAGALVDNRCADVTRRLRQYRNRYAPILRLVTTLIAPVMEESQLFGDDDSCVESAAVADDGRLKEGVTEMAGATAVVGGDGALRGRNGGVKRGRGEPLITAPRCAVVAEKRIIVVHRLHDKEVPDAVEKLERFMSYHFLPLALLHNCQPNISPDDVPFVLRHYVHEATRTASFLVADLSKRAAAIIDPQVDVSCYEEDLAFLQVQLVGIVLTHCFVDIAMGHAALLEHHPTAKLLSGTPFVSTGYGCSDGLSLHLSSRLHLRCISVPSFSPECLVVELHLDAQLLALFTGTVMGTDAVPRYEFFGDFPLPLEPQGDLQHTSAMPAPEVARRFLRERVWDAYFFPDPAAGHVQPWDHVVVFPSHGGYSNVTHQLDLYWAVHIGDMKRMKHSRTVMDKILDPEKYAQHMLDRPRLPKPLLVSHVREWNLLSVPSAFGGSGEGLLRRRLLPPPACALTSPCPGPVVVDIRSAADHVTMHLKGSVNVPMTFPAAAYGVKKAELWLQCMLKPLQPVVVVCANERQCHLARQRLELISPGASVETFTLQELCPPCGVHAVDGQEKEVFNRVDVTTSLPATVDSRHLPRHLTWVFDSTASAQSRLDCYQKLQFIEPAEDTLVLDCRTPYEFRNGSHTRSVFLSLGDLCHITALDLVAQQLTPEADVHCGGWPSPELGRIILDRMYEAALASGLKCRPGCRGIRKIVVYCATGYRSLIAASLMRRAFEAASLDIVVYDVAGGALQVMQQRPDLWTVKDRSIICIS